MNSEADEFQIATFRSIKLRTKMEDLTNVKCLASQKMFQAHLLKYVYYSRQDLLKRWINTNNPPFYFQVIVEKPAESQSVPMNAINVPLLVALNLIHCTVKLFHFWSPSLVRFSIQQKKDSWMLSQLE